MEPTRPSSRAARRAACVLAACAAVVVPVASVLADARFGAANGDVFDATHRGPGTDDAYEIDVPAGAVVRAKCRGRGAFGPILALADPTSGETPGTQGRSSSSLRTTAAASGRHRLLVRAAGAVGGDYRLSVKWAPVRKSVATAADGAGGLGVSVAAEDGARLSVKLSPRSLGESGPPLVTRILDAAGSDPIELGVPAPKNVLVAGLGAHRVLIDDHGTAVPVRATVSIRPPRVRPARIDIRGRTLDGDPGSEGPTVVVGARIDASGGDLVVDPGAAAADPYTIAGAAITVPPDVVALPTALFIAPAVPLVLEDGVSPVGAAVFFGPSGTTFGTQTDPRSVTLTIPVDSARIGNNRNDLRIRTRDRRGRESQLPVTPDGAPDARIELATPGFASFPTSHFSSYVATLLYPQEASFTASGPAGTELLGQSVAIDGDTVVAGAPGADASHGAVYVYTRAAGAWSESQRIVQPTEGLSGTCVAVRGDTLAFGAPGAGAGAAWVYTRTGGTFSESQRLTGPADAGSEFGASVSLDGSRIAVGSPRDAADVGTVRTFTASGGTWTPEQTLSPAGSAADAHAGDAVLLDGDTLVVGAGRENAGNGAVYVYERVDGTWTQTQRLLPDTAEIERFGTSLALEGDRLAVGAPGNPDGAHVYTFTRVGTSWTNRERIDYGARTGIGQSVALRGGLLFAGLPHSDGVVYVYAHGTAGWDLIRSIVPVGVRGSSQTQMGFSAAVSGDVGVFGGPLDDDLRGAIYIVRR